MNMMTTIPTSAAATMSSLEIAELTGKEHRNVMRDIRNMLDAIGGTQLSFERSYKDSTGRTLPCYHLPYDETITLVSGYDVVLRHKIVRRWKELEQAKPALPNFSNPAEAARAWAERYKSEQQALSNRYKGRYKGPPRRPKNIN